MLFLSGMASLSYGVLVGLVRRVFQVGPKTEADYDTPQSSEPPPPRGPHLACQWSPLRNCLVHETGPKNGRSYQPVRSA